MRLSGFKLALLVCGFYYIMLVSNGLSAVTSLTAASSASCQLTLNISLPHSPFLPPSLLPSALHTDAILLLDVSYNTLPTSYCRVLFALLSLLPLANRGRQRQVLPLLPRLLLLLLLWCLSHSPQAPHYAVNAWQKLIINQKCINCSAAHILLVYGYAGYAELGVRLCALP